MLGLKLNHVSKRGHWWFGVSWSKSKEHVNVMVLLIKTLAFGPSCREIMCLVSMCVMQYLQ